MGAAVGSIGLVGFLVAAVWLIIAAIRKRPKRVPAGLLGAFFVLFVVGGILTETTATPEGRQSEEVATLDPTPTPTATSIAYTLPSPKEVALQYLLLSYVIRQDFAETFESLRPILERPIWDSEVWQQELVIRYVRFLASYSPLYRLHPPQRLEAYHKNLQDASTLIGDAASVYLYAVGNPSARLDARSQLNNAALLATDLFTEAGLFIERWTEKEGLKSLSTERIPLGAPTKSWEARSLAIHLFELPSTAGYGEERALLILHNRGQESITLGLQDLYIVRYKEPATSRDFVGPYPVAFHPDVKIQPPYVRKWDLREDVIKQSVYLEDAVIAEVTWTESYFRTITLHPEEGRIAFEVDTSPNTAGEEFRGFWLAVNGEEFNLE